MKSIISRKKVVFAFCFLFVVLLSAGFYFWIKNDIDINKNAIIVKSADISEFEIKDIDGRKIIENKKEKFSAEVPKDWTIKKFKYNDNENEVTFFSPESEFDDQGNFIAKKSYLEKGACVMGIAIKKCEKSNSNVLTDAEIISNYIMGIKDKSSENFDSGRNWAVISVSGKDLLSRITKEDNKITSIRAEAPIGETIYSFATGYIVNQNCVKYFDDFLKTVLINN